MAEKPQQESFLAQLSEVEVTPVPPQIVEVLQIDPAFGTKVDIINFGESSNHVKSEHLETVTSKDPTDAEPSSFVTTTALPAPPQTANGESAAQMQNSSRTTNSTPQTVTGNVKIQLMEISVDEFKTNVEYIQQQFPTLPRRLICDTFSKANFDCRLAMELLAKEQEKKDQSIVPPMVLAAAAAAAAAAAKQQQQQQTPKSSASTPAPPATPPTTPTAAAATTPKLPAASSPHVTPPSRGKNSRRSTHASTSSGGKEDPCYRRVASVDKEAERVLRQKLKNNVRSRVFNHGVKIAHGRETAANVFQHQLASPSAAPAAAADADSSLDASTTRSEEEPPALAVAADVTAATAAADADADAAADAQEAVEEPQDAAPQSPMRILRDSFPSLDEARIAETLEACDRDVDAAIRVLSGRPMVRAAEGGGDAGGGGGAKFFKSRAAQQLLAARKGYVRAELSTGAWMDHKTASAVSRAATAAARGAPAVSTLRVYTVQPKRRIKEGIPDCH